MNSKRLQQTQNETKISFFCTKYRRQHKIRKWSLTKIWKISEKRIKQILELKDSSNQIKNTLESHSSRLEQVEEEYQGLKTK
jgi:hypothetical protein